MYSCSIQIIILVLVINALYTVILTYFYTVVQFGVSKIFYVSERGLLYGSLFLPQNIIIIIKIFVTFYLTILRKLRYKFRILTFFQNCEFISCNSENRKTVVINSYLLEKNQNCAIQRFNSLFYFLSHSKNKLPYSYVRFIYLLAYLFFIKNKLLEFFL